MSTRISFFLKCLRQHLQQFHECPYITHRPQDHSKHFLRQILLIQKEETSGFQVHSLTSGTFKRKPSTAISYTLFWDSPGRISTRCPLCPIQVEVRIIKDRSLKARIYFKNICSLKRKELLSYRRDEIVEQKISFIGSQKWRKVEKGFMFKDFNRISWIRGRQ